MFLTIDDAEAGPAALTPVFSLDDALREIAATKWRHGAVRSPRTKISHAEIAIRMIERVMLGKSTPKPARRPPGWVEGSTVRHVQTIGRFDFAITTPPPPLSRLPPLRHLQKPERPTGPGAAIPVAAVKQEHVKKAVRLWFADGLSPATVIQYLSALSVLGIDTTGCRPRRQRQPKWWLNPKQEEAILAHLASKRTFRAEALADLIVWTTRTGLRIEESLRLRWSEVHDRGTHTSITVPGTKNSGAQATIPISAEANMVLQARRTLDDMRVFAVSYRQMQGEWAASRVCLGLEDPKRATLKALRRSAARALHASRGMPLHLVQAILRHRNVSTTMGYLHLTGGYGEDELARWL